MTRTCGYVYRARSSGRSISETGSSRVVLPPGTRTARPNRVLTARSFWSTVYTPIRRIRKRNQAISPRTMPAKICIGQLNGKYTLSDVTVWFWGLGRVPWANRGQTANFRQTAPEIHVSPQFAECLPWANRGQTANFRQTAPEIHVSPQFAGRLPCGANL